MYKRQKYGVHPELECFDLGMINYGKYLIQKKRITEPCYWNLIFGNIAGFQTNLNQIAVAINEIPRDHYVGIGGIGDYQLKANSIAISSGKGVRIGMEDNLWYDKNKKVAASNINLLKRVHSLIEINESRLMSSKELGLSLIHI